MAKNKYMEVGDWMLAAHSLLRDRYERLWYWDQKDKRWVCDEDRYWFSRQVQDLVKSQQWAERWNPAFEAAVERYLLPRLDTPWERAPLDRLHVENGIIDLRGGGPPALVEPTPAFRFVNRLPVRYEPGATPDVWYKHLERSMEPEVIEVLWEILAWIAFSMKDVNAIICLNGEAGSGKSRILEGIRAFTGPENLIVVSRNELEGNRFMKAHISYKLLVMYDDLPSTAGADNGVLKMIADGSAMQTDVKFKRPQWVVNYANCIFASNWAPRSVDTSDGFFDRWCILPMQRRLRFSDVQIPATTIDRELAAPDQLSGVLNKVLEARDRIIRNRWKFTSPRVLERARDDFRMEADPILQWFYQRLQVVAGSQIRVEDAHADFALWCSRQHIRNIATQSVFARVIKNHFEARGLNVEARRSRDTDGNQRSTWIGLGWRAGSFPPL